MVHTLRGINRSDAPPYTRDDLSKANCDDKVESRCQRTSHAAISSGRKPVCTLWYASAQVGGSPRNRAVAVHHRHAAISLPTGFSDCSDDSTKATHSMVLKLYEKKKRETEQQCLARLSKVVQSITAVTCIFCRWLIFGCRCDAMLLKRQGTRYGVGKINFR